MLPLWPSINPSLVGSLMNNGSASVVNEEQEISALEHEQQNYLNLVETIAQDLTPLGKMQSSEQNNEDSDAESEDDPESSASEAEDHESEDDNDGRESFTVNY